MNGASDFILSIFGVNQGGMEVSLSCWFSLKYLNKVFFLFVLHYNFSANILLDDQFQPKLTDFAMAHFRPHLEQQSSTISTTSSRNKHLWYFPEEYIRQGKFSVKTDVYSFGIVSSNCLLFMNQRVYCQKCSKL